MRATLHEAWHRLAALGGETIARLPIIAVAVVVFFIFYFVARFVRSMVYRLSRRYQHGHSAGLVFGRIAQAGIITLGVLVALVISVPTFQAGDLVGFLGVGSIAVGFAFRDILQNFLAGILILLTQPFRIGDQIVVEGYEGTVEEIQTRATFLKTYDGRRVVIPNADLFTNSVTVNTAFPHRRIEQTVGIGYGDDIATARRLIVEAMRETDGVLADPAPDAIVVGFGASSVDLRARWWVEPPQKISALNVQDRVLEAIKRRLNENGIDLPCTPALPRDQEDRGTGARGDNLGVEPSRGGLAHRSRLVGPSLARGVRAGGGDSRPLGGGCGRPLAHLSQRRRAPLPVLRLRPPRHAGQVPGVRNRRSDARMKRRLFKVAASRREHPGNPVQPRASLSRRRSIRRRSSGRPR